MRLSLVLSFLLVVNTLYFSSPRKPLVCLFPASFKRSLLYFLHLVYNTLPKDCVLNLLDCLSQEGNAASWTAALVGQLHRDIREEGSREILTPQCRLSVTELCEQFKGTGRRGGWCSYFAKPKVCQTGTVPSSQPQKRKSENLDLDFDLCFEGQQSKRMKMELPNSAEAGIPELAGRETEASPAREYLSQDKTVIDDGVVPNLHPPDPNNTILPDHIKVIIFILPLSDSG